ncbi:ParA family protein [Stieleria sp. TO1_6]|uniref:ParA family protein n=1 Tax=Stieleria tagensis TaxID=2956795 RepID=UPI00209AE581|nr:ParA family protein [Stieleria tagensis]MCO8124079.1 ParA family protein [Stieleria tagensis]
MPLLLMINLKGGVGKTASTVALAETLAEQGQRTLVIDADHQSMAGELLVGESRMMQAERRGSTLHDVFLSMADVDFDPGSLGRYVIRGASNVLATENRLSVIPCSFRIDDFFSNLARSSRLCRTYTSEREILVQLQRQMRKMDRWLRTEFDFVLVDCPPSVAMQVRLFMKVADGYVIPSIPDQLSMRGTHNLVQRISKYGYKMTGLGTLWTLYRSQVALHREMVRDPFPGIPTPFQAVIPNSTRLAEAVDPRHIATAQINCDAKYTKEFAGRYRAIADELIERCRSAGIGAGRCSESAFIG